MNDPLTVKDCYRLFSEYGAPPHIIRHCEAVSRVAFSVVAALRAIGMDLDPDLARRAALLHDLVRTEKDHAAKAAAIVARYDEAAAAIIREHMRHDMAKDVSSITEGDIVILADRSVLEDRYVGYEKRIEAMMERFSDDPTAVAILRGKLEETAAFVRSIEELLGRSIDDVASGGAVEIEGLLRRVTKPGRYAGGEPGAVLKNPAETSLHIAFCFPDLYEIGMSYTGMQILYGLLNSLDGVCCERVFAPAPDMEALMRAGWSGSGSDPIADKDEGPGGPAGEPLPLFTLETRTPVSRTDLVAFTLQYELSYTNILNMLDLAGLPLRATDRGEDAPFVCAGGSLACNPEPLADAFDFIVIGDGEDVFPEICRRHADWKRNKNSREAFLESLARLEGVYVPSFYEPVYDDGGLYARHEAKRAGLSERVKKRTIDDLDAAYYPRSPVVPLIEAVHERAVCEIARGCGRGCRFCQAGYVYRPVRHRSPERVRAIIDAQLANTGYDEVSLLSLSAGDYPGIEPLVAGLMDDLKEKDVSLSLPSLRLDTISQDVLSRIASYKKSSLTFAPEAGTQRLRDVVRKNITEDDIIRGVEKAIGIGWNRVKLYFMIGLPTETDEDLEGIALLAETIMEKARALQEKGRRNFSLTVSVSNFVPKPHTPFQWASGERDEILVKKMYRLKDRFRAVRGVSFKFHDTRASAVEMMLAKGDRRMFAAIKRAWELGCRFDSWREHFDFERWERAFGETGMPIGADRYTDTAAPLPWDIVDMGTGKELLVREYERALTAGADPSGPESCGGMI